jgi:hypothetical protein
MPFFLAALLGGLATVMGSMVGRVLLALGITYVTYKGMTVAVDSVSEMMRSSFQSFSGDVLNLLSFLYVDRALSLIISSFAAAFALRSSSGAITKMVIKK